VWNFHVGGYQVCEKWLKDRRGRTLTKGDIAHYQKIEAALAETIRLMKEIDGVIKKHGGWPGAFSGNLKAHLIRYRWIPRQRQTMSAMPPIATIQGTSPN
jgi:hypothetical protein